MHRLSRPLSLTGTLLLALAAAPFAAAQTNFDARLFGQAEVPAVATDASGSCVGFLEGFEAGGDPTFQLSCIHDVEGAIAAHIHRGFPGEPGPIIFDLGDPTSPIQASWDLSVEQAIRLIAGGYYVNVHTPANPGGEIRGQLLASPPTDPGLERMGIALSGGQEVPFVVTDASGACFLELRAEPDDFVSGIETGTASLYCAHDIENPTQAHIHDGARGVAGPVLIGLGDPDSPIVHEDVEVDSEFISKLRAGDLYVNVHTMANMGGEIRGQLDNCLASPTVLCLQDGRFSVEVDFSTTQGGGALGDGRAVPETIDSGMFWFFRPSNLELLVKVLDGCAVNGNYWVFFAGTTNVGFQLRVTDERTDQRNDYTSPDLQTTEAELDTAAFSTCVID